MLVKDGGIGFLEDLKEVLLAGFTFVFELSKCNEVFTIRAIVSLKARRHCSEVHRADFGSDSAAQAGLLFIQRVKTHAETLRAPETADQAFSVAPGHEGRDAGTRVVEAPGVAHTFRRTCLVQASVLTTEEKCHFINY